MAFCTSWRNPRKSYPTTLIAHRIRCQQPVCRNHGTWYALLVQGCYDRNIYSFSREILMLLLIVEWEIMEQYFQHKILKDNVKKQVKRKTSSSNKLLKIVCPLKRKRLVDSGHMVSSWTDGQLGGMEKEKKKLPLLLPSTS